MQREREREREREPVCVCRLEKSSGRKIRVEMPDTLQHVDIGRREE
jgi:hypothetical protein